MTARPVYRRNMKHSLDKDLEGSDHNLKKRRDSSQNPRHVLQQSRSMKWKIQQYKPVQVMFVTYQIICNRKVSSMDFSNLKTIILLPSAGMGLAVQVM